MANDRRIIVGVDGSSGGDTALRWGAAEAALRGAELVALMAWGYLDQRPLPGHEGFDPSYGQATVEAALAAFVEQALGPDEAGAVTQSAVCDLPARALLDAAHDADLLVVGARGFGGFRGLLLGSVSQRLLHEARSPLALVREGSPGVEGGPVVVGIDGSESSRQALHWAVDEARLRAVGLKAVHVWREPGAGGEAFGLAIDTEAWARSAKELVDSATEPAETEEPVPVERVVVRGNAAAALIEASSTAALLVVGNRGHGRWGRLTAGSVAQQVAHHGRCPVVLIPEAR